MAKVLLWDVEIFPLHFYTGLGADRSTLSHFGYKWLDEKKTHCIDLSIRKNWAVDPFNEKALVKASHKILNEADVFITHYGVRFDLPFMNAKFIKYGLEPVIGKAHIDTWMISKTCLKLSNNKLKTVATMFGLDNKMDIGIETWFHALSGKPAALRKMNIYCKQDVDTLEQVYLKTRNIYPRHPSFAVLDLGSKGAKGLCGICSSARLHKRGYYVTKAGRYDRLHCQDCGKWSTSTCMSK